MLNRRSLLCGVALAPLAGVLPSEARIAALTPLPPPATSHAVAVARYIGAIIGMPPEEASRIEAFTDLAPGDSLGVRLAKHLFRDMLRTGREAVERRGIVLERFAQLSAGSD